MSNTIVKAITIKQPWASLIACGAKDIENRDWRCNFKGPLAIHSSARMSPKDMYDACDFMQNFIPRFSRGRFMQDKFPTGVILGTVEMVGCVSESKSHWFVGSYGFVFTNPVKLEEPIPCRGSLGLWDLPDDIGTFLAGTRSCA